MLRERILGLFREYDPDVQQVIAKVIEAEWAKLSYERPRGIVEEIRQIIDDTVELNDDEA